MQFSYIICTDNHADLNSFIYPLLDFLEDPIHQKLIYLGDYYDRGNSDIFIFEIMLLISNHQKQYPNSIFKNVIFLRGNHEITDNSTIDFLGQVIANNDEGTIRSFIVKYAIKLLNLKPFYYDKNLNILFSHSAYSTSSLYSLLSVNNTESLDMLQALTASSEKPLPYKNCQYFNIHGHDHSCASLSDIKDFFDLVFKNKNNPNSTCTQISLDNNASYGFDVLKNIANLAVDKHEQIITPATHLFYLKFSTQTHNQIKINPGEINQNTLYLSPNVSVVMNTIELNNKSNNFLNRTLDFNSKSFNFIKNILIETTNAHCADLIKNDNPWQKLSLNVSQKLFIQELEAIRNKLKLEKLYVEKLIRKLFTTTYNIDKYYLPKLYDFNHLYFHNIPVEIYAFLGEEVTDNYKPCYMKFIEIMSHSNYFSYGLRLRQIYNIK